tara:strand:- start:109 stop:1743 length:1635 start_codon:yes stop_codon:yes gene_type:complete
MKKIAILLSLIVSVPLIAQGQKHKTYFKDFLVTANAGQLVGVNDVSEDGVIDAIDDTCKITYNIHESLPSDWVTEFYVIMDTLSMIIPLYQTYYEKVAIYAWNNIFEDPYPGVDGGQYISMKDGNPMMVLEISNNEFVHNSMHRYSVIAHEYFHLYQKSITKGMNATHANQYEPFGVKWLIEGTAASFESLYIRQNYNINYFGAQANLNSELLTDPSVFEIYVNNEVNYGSSVFLVLVLVKELIKSGYSEEAAFRLIYKEYLLLNPNIQNWKTVFDSVFPFSLEDFYNTVKTYDLDLNLVLPSETLKIEDILKPVMPDTFSWASPNVIDTLNISQSNLTDTLFLNWTHSDSPYEPDYLTYRLHLDGKLFKSIRDTLIYLDESPWQRYITSDTLLYQDFLDNWPAQFQMLPRKTFTFDLWAWFAGDSIKINDGSHYVYVNRYDYLSTEEGAIPTEFALHENYPNPFNPTTTLRFDLPEVSYATVTIFNMLGQKVRTFNMNNTPAGYHSIKWDATNDYGDPVGAGVYLYQLRANEFVKTKKMVLLK